MMSMRLTIVQTQCAPMCSNLFPAVEAFLDESTDRMNALRILYEGSNGKRKPDEYRDKIDFIFCELFPGYVKKCFAYYRGKGKSLRDLPEATDRQIRRWEKMLLIGVTTAYDWFCEKRRVEEWGWEELRKVVLAA